MCLLCLHDIAFTVLLYSTIENANNQKLMAEYEKYQELQARSQKLQEVCWNDIICKHT